MENYIVRIYRRDADDPQKIAGLVELVGIEQKESFANFDELRDILGPAKKDLDAPGNKKRNL